MKRILLIVFCLLGIMVAVHEIQAHKQGNYGITIDGIIEKNIQQREECSHLNNSKTFINYDVLGVAINAAGDLEYNIVASGKGYYIDERGNISNDCSFSDVPIVIVISEDKNGYFVVSYKKEKNQSDFLQFAKENFSEKGYRTRLDKQRHIDNKKNNTLLLAEQYFGVSLDEKLEYDCEFCEIPWYYYDTIKNKSGEYRKLYGIEQIDDNGFVFHLNGTVQKFGSSEKGKFIRYFNKDESTLIIKNEENKKSIERFIIEDLNDREMTFFTETIHVY